MIQDRDCPVTILHQQAFWGRSFGGGFSVSRSLDRPLRSPVKLRACHPTPVPHASARSSDKLTGVSFHLSVWRGSPSRALANKGSGVTTTGMGNWYPVVKTKKG